jgi:hypothetical protein
MAVVIGATNETNNVAASRRKNGRGRGCLVSTRLYHMVVVCCCVDGNRWKRINDSTGRDVMISNHKFKTQKTTRQHAKTLSISHYFIYIERVYSFLW